MEPVWIERLGHDWWEVYYGGIWTFDDLKCALAFSDHILSDVLLNLDAPCLHCGEMYNEEPGQHGG